MRDAGSRPYCGLVCWPRTAGRSGSGTSRPANGGRPCSAAQGAVTEAEFQLAVEAKLAETGLLWHHCTRPETCRGSAGFPDLIVAGWDRWSAVELKSGDGRRSLAQIDWANRAAAAGLEYLLGRPPDLDALAVILNAMT